MAELRRLRRPAGVLLAAGLLAGLAFLVAGCGGSSAGTNAPSTTTTGTSPATQGRSSAAFQAFSACLKQHGVTVPAFGGRRPGERSGTRTTPPTSGSGARTFPRRALSPAQQKAYQACQSKLPSGGAFGRGRFGGGSQSPAFAKYTKCLKAHGVSFGGAQNATKFQKAQQACAKYRPAFGSGAGSPRTTTTTGTSSG
jgi:hypothetical protein